MITPLTKNTFREVVNNFSRFMSIFAIIAIGVGFFAGIKSTGTDMKLTADKYYQDSNLMDIRLLSTMGFNDNDVDAIKNTSGVSMVSPANFLDVFVERDDSKDEVRIHSLPTTINLPRLMEGHLPKKSGECLVEVAFLRSGLYSIGDTIKLKGSKDENVTDYLARDEYTIVGTVYSPQYISYERGNTTIGNGSLDYFIMILTEDFTVDYYTEVYLTNEEAQKVYSFSDSYQDIISDLEASLKATATIRQEERHQEILSEANDKLNDAKDEFDKGQKEFEDGMDKANKEFKKAQGLIDDGYRQLNKQKATFTNEINSAQDKINTSLKEIENNEIILNEGFKQLEEGKAALEEQKKQLDTMKDLMPVEDYEIALAEYNKQLTNLLAQEASLTEDKAQLDGARLSLEAAQKDLDANKSQGLSQLKKGKKELETNQKKLNRSKEEFEVEKAKSQKELDDAREEIVEAKQEISEIEKPKWYINTRDDNPAYTEYGQNADRIDAIASVFPVFFLLVAALVSLTTMTRMIEEQRTYIGTLKALGYSRLKIISKYFIYANTASILGSIAGLLIGFQLFPWVIFSAYGIMYDFPPVISPFHMDFAFYSVVAAVLCTSLSVILACSKELHAQPATLMRPKAPKSGKRVWLERVTIIWGRLNFTTKVTARNLFRYKKRMLMTVIGIAGCTALTLTGFGIKDSISDISHIQFRELSTYDILVALDKDKDSSNMDERLDNNPNIINSTKAQIDTVNIESERANYSANLFVAQDAQQLKSLIHFRTYKDKKPLSLSDEGVMITYKLSTLLEKEIGDSILIKDINDREATVTIAGICENYISHYIYMTPAYFEKAFQELPTYSTILATMKDSSPEYQTLISDELLDLENVVGLSFTHGIIETFDNLISSLNYVVLVLILSASLLAFVVLYNLTNINVNERLREIATIKVLGFYDNEVSAYIYRENMILTIMGIFVGFGLGTVLHQFVMRTAEVNDLMFGRSIYPPSYIISGLLTIAFAISVNIVLHFRLKKIDMVESLKSVE